MYISYNKEEEREFVYKYKDKLLSLQKEKNYCGLDLECIEGAPEIDIITKFGRERGILYNKQVSIEYTQEELEEIPYFLLCIDRISNPDNALAAGVKYDFKCKSCCSEPVQVNSIELPIKRFLDYDIFCIEPELFVNCRIKEAFEQANITGCEYLDVIDKRTKKTCKDIYQLKINPVLPDTIMDEYAFVKYTCTECGKPSMLFSRPYYYKLDDFKDGYDLYLTKESLFMDNRVYRCIPSYRIPHIIISKRVKNILERFIINHCEFYPVYFDELFNSDNEDGKGE